MNKELRDLLALSASSPWRALRRWWLKRVENHYLMCAESEQMKMNEARLNIAYYQKRAAIARSAQLD